MSPRPAGWRRLARILSFLLATAPLAAAGRLEVSPPALDFGDRGHGERPELALALRNAGADPLRITQVEKSCGCLELSPPAVRRSLAPGESMTLRVTMSSGRVTGVVHKVLTIHTDGEPRSVKVPARMSVFPGFRTDPLQLRFDGEVGGEPATRSVTISFDPRERGAGAGRRGSFDFHYEGVFRNPGHQSLDRYFTSWLEEATSGKRLALTLLPTMPEGRFMATVETRVNGKPFHISLSGEMFRGIKVTPTYFNFNRVVPGDPATLEEEVVLAAIGDHPLKVLSSRYEMNREALDGLGLELTPESSRDGRRWTIRARLLLPEEVRAMGPPPGQERFSGSVEVRTDHPEKPGITLRFFGFFPRDSLPSGRSG